MTDNPFGFKVVEPRHSVKMIWIPPTRWEKFCEWSTEIWWYVIAPAIAYALIITGIQLPFLLK